MKDETVHKIIHYMMIFMLVVAVIALVLYPDKEAKAEDLNLHLIVIDSPLSPSPEDQIRLFKEGLSRLSEIGVTPIYKSIRVVPDYFQANDLKQWLSRLFIWKKWGKKLHLKDQKIFLLPPMLDSKTGLDYGGGMAGAVCTTKRNRSRRFTQVVMRLVNNSGADRQQHSRVIALHEVMHILGANHAGYGLITKPNIMSLNAQSYAKDFNTLQILPVSFKQIGYCRKGRTPNNK